MNEVNVCLPSIFFFVNTYVDAQNGSHTFHYQLFFCMCTHVILGEIMLDKQFFPFFFPFHCSICFLCCLIGYFQGEDMQAMIILWDYVIEDNFLCCYSLLMLYGVKMSWLGRGKLMAVHFFRTLFVKFLVHFLLNLEQNVLFKIVCVCLSVRRGWKGKKEKEV